MRSTSALIGGSNRTSRPRFGKASFSVVASDIVPFDGAQIKAPKVYELMMSQGCWEFTERSPHRSELKAGDTLIFYLGGNQGRYIAGAAELAGEIVPIIKRSANTEPLMWWSQTALWLLDALNSSLSLVLRTQSERRERHAVLPRLPKLAPVGLLAKRRSGRNNYEGCAVTDKPGIWIIRGGSKGQADSLFLQQGLVGLAWSKVLDLRQLTDRKGYRDAVAKAYPEKKHPSSIGSAAGQLFRFYTEILEGDLVVYPSKIDKALHFGFVAGSYEYRPDAPHGFVHLRPVRWLGECPRSLISSSARDEIGSITSFFKVNRMRDEFLKISAKLEKQRARK